jgi:hypothetical protein
LHRAIARAPGAEAGLTGSQADVVERLELYASMVSRPCAGSGSATSARRHLWIAIRGYSGVSPVRRSEFLKTFFVDPRRLFGTVGATRNPVLRARSRPLRHPEVVTSRYGTAARSAAVEELPRLPRTQRSRAATSRPMSNPQRIGNDGRREVEMIRRSSTR